MFHSRYSEMEMDQWQDACAESAHAKHDATRHHGARAAMAKGQADKNMTRSAAAAMPTELPQHDDWASECLFDCYNG